jgi:hypothetical protein
MSSSKIMMFFYFVLSLVCVLVNVDMSTWLYLEVIYLFISVVNFKNTFKERFPFGELITIVFFLENAFAISMIYYLQGDQLQTGSYYYTRIPIEEYLPFSFLASQAVLLGYYLVRMPSEIWRGFIRDFNSIVKKNTLDQLLIVGVIGALLNIFKIPFVGYVAYVLNYFLTSALIGYALYYKSPSNRYFLFGLGLNLVSAIRGAMFGGLIYFVAYFVLLYLFLLIQSGKKLKWGSFVFVGVAGTMLLALMQNVKGDYRSDVWRGSAEAGTSVFINTISDNLSLSNFADVEFYLPLLYRLNQGYQVSAVMERVPSNEPFANGRTIVSSLSDALVPRILNPLKEQAGGKDKIARFTYLILSKGTSMNIGYLGEAYANFGKVGGVCFIVAFGFFLALFEKKVLLYSKKQPLILVLFPIFFQIMVGTGRDFLMLLNGTVKGILIILIVLYFIEKASRKVFTPTVSV